MNKKLSEFWRQWLKPMLIAVAILAPLRSVVADWNDVPTGSMRPTILVGDRIWINKLAYDLKMPFTTIHLATWSDPQRGDIIVFRSPADGKRLVKRVVAVPGDVIEMRNDQLFLNGQPASYATSGAVPGESAFVFDETISSRTHAMMICPRLRAMRSFGPVRVPARILFCHGRQPRQQFRFAVLGVRAAQLDRGPGHNRGDVVRPRTLLVSPVRPVCEGFGVGLRQFFGRGKPPARPLRRNVCPAGDPAGRPYRVSACKCGFVGALRPLPRYFTWNAPAVAPLVSTKSFLAALRSVFLMTMPPFLSPCALMTASAPAG